MKVSEYDYHIKYGTLITIAGGARFPQYASRLRDHPALQPRQGIFPQRALSLTALSVRFHLSMLVQVPDGVLPGTARQGNELIQHPALIPLRRLCIPVANGFEYLGPRC